jgi:hypothetical protein
MRAAALLMMMTMTANAAEPAICRGYATELLNMHMKWMWTRAYTHCINEEEDSPKVPDNWEGAMRVIDPLLTPIMSLDQGNVAAVMEGMPTPPSRPAAAPAPTGKAGKSGFPTGSDDWKRWCRQNYPRSWDAKSGTVILPTSRQRARSPCPG